MRIYDFFVYIRQNLYYIILFISFKPYTFYKNFKDNKKMFQQINSNLKQMVPYYEEASDFTVKTCQQTFKTVSQIQTRLENKVSLTKKNVLNLKQGLQNQILNLAEQASNELLIRTEKLLLSEQQRPSETQKKQIKKRFQRVFNKIMNDYIIFYAQQAKNYNMALIKKGQTYVYTYVLPMYIKLKATILITKEILIELLQSGLDDMKMTYSISKDTVTMLIGGKFDEQKIIAKINSGMQNFKQFTVKVVKKGLEIKVDKQSLYENYEIFSLKVLEAIREMRQKGAQRIVSAKQKTAQLYRNVLSRIRQKQITLKMEYKQLEDKKETQHESSGQTKQ